MWNEKEMRIVIMLGRERRVRMWQEKEMRIVRV